MTIRLRGHHLLCLMGYRGKGYSEAFCANMTEVYETLRTKPDTIVTIVEGPDDICAHFPENQPSHCENDGVYDKDEEILNLLAVTGRSLPWAEVCERVADRVRPDRIRTLCGDCRWMPLGLCEQGVGIMREERVLPKLPDE